MSVVNKLNEALKWVVNLVAGLFTGREPIVIAGAALAFVTHAEPILEQVVTAQDWWEVVGILAVAFSGRSQYTPVKNRG